MTLLYLLDTNTVSYVIKGRPPSVRERLAATAPGSVAISVVTRGELRYGLARKGNPPRLTKVVEAFLLRTTTLPWDDGVADAYGKFRATCSGAGVALGALDTMIAAHASAMNLTLVSSDRAFKHVPRRLLRVEDWTADG